MKNKIIISILFLFIIIDTEAQCAMCRAVLESEDGQSAAKGINNGIIYLMSIPYLLFFGMAYFIYRKYFRSKKE